MVVAVMVAVTTVDGVAAVMVVAVMVVAVMVVAMVSLCC